MSQIADIVEGNSPIVRAVQRQPQEAARISAKNSLKPQRLAN
jgi:hypothetical protein